MSIPAPTLNERLALALGWRRCEEYPEYWVKPGDSQPTADPGLCYECPSLLTGDGMLVVLEALRGKGYRLRAIEFTDGWYAAFSRECVEQEPWQVAQADTLPRAVAEAALRALEKDDE